METKNKYKRSRKLLCSLILLCVVLLPVWVYAAVAVDAVTASKTSSDHSTHAFDHTCTGSDLVLFVSLSYANAVSITALTYNAVSLTQIGKTDDGSSHYQELWYLEDPATGENEVSITLSSSSNYGAYIAHSYTGADAVQNANTATTTSDYNSVTVTTTSANSWVVVGAFWLGKGSEPFTPDGGDTEQWDDWTGWSSSLDAGFTGGYLETTTTGEYTWGSTATASRATCIVGAELTVVDGVPPEAGQVIIISDASNFHRPPRAQLNWSKK